MSADESVIKETPSAAVGSTDNEVCPKTSVCLKNDEKVPVETHENNSKKELPSETSAAEVLETKEAFVTNPVVRKNPSTGTDSDIDAFIRTHGDEATCPTWSEWD